MGVFDSLKQAELQEACKTRELPAGGTNAEMIARLEQYEADLLSEGTDDTPDGGEDGSGAGAPDGDGPPQAGQDIVIDGEKPRVFAVDAPQVVVGETAAPTQPRTFRVVYPCPGGLSTDQHEQLRLAAHGDAVQAGYAPRGLAGVSRIGWQTINGVQHAVYEVMLRRA